MAQKRFIDMGVTCEAVTRGENGALMEPLAVAVHAANRPGNVEGRNIAVLGSGPIGILLAQVLTAFGADVLITDISDHRLELAKKLGIRYQYIDENRERTMKVVIDVSADQ